MEQTAANSEVSENTQRVSGEITELARMNETIAAAGAETTQAAEQTWTSVASLKELSDSLMARISDFKT